MRYNIIASFKSAIFCIHMLLFSNLVTARFVAPEEAASEIQFLNYTIDVKEDGTFEWIVELQVKILGDSGRLNIATRPLYYDEATQKLDVINAKAIYNREEFPVTSEFIEDKSIASQTTGFSSSRQVLIAFPRLHIGTEIYLKYTLHQTIPDLPKTFFAYLPYGAESYWKSSQVRLTSSIPFSFAVNDPEGFLNLQSKHEENRQILEISLIKPIIKQVADEQNILLDHKIFPSVSITSVKDWKTLIKKIIPEYERTLAQPLPSLFQEISNQAAQEPDLYKKINCVTSMLAKEIHYMGDWRTVLGRIYPHDLEMTAQNRRGDCKDFATVTTAILRSLGIKATVALVQRGGYHDELNNLPSTNKFNHAIVRVEADKQILWIDPTNFVSFAHGLFPDIANRWALPLLATAKDREKIPAIKPEQSEISIVEDIKFSSKDRTLVKGSLVEKGAAAIGMTGASLRASKKNIDYALISFVGDVNRMRRWKIRPYNLDSRIVKDVKFEYEYETRNLALKTSDGLAHLLEIPTIISQYFTRTQDRVSDLLILEQPGVRKITTRLNGVKLTGKSNLNCTLESRWLDASREVSQKKMNIEVKDVFIIKSGLITNAELQTKEFTMLQEKLGECFSNIAAIFKR